MGHSREQRYLISYNTYNIYKFSLRHNQTYYGSQHNEMHSPSRSRGFLQITTYDIFPSSQMTNLKNSHPIVAFLSPQNIGDECIRENARYWIHNDFKNRNLAMRLPSFQNISRARIMAVHTTSMMSTTKCSNGLKSKKSDSSETDHTEGGTWDTTWYVNTLESFWGHQKAL